ncbi:MAG: hypothetical protein R3343_12705 [Nitriliruptorales bacterium]|nr:hypothetical protein [Nitriliruptorales bacterium]
MAEETNGQRAARLGLAAFLGGMTVLHVTHARAFAAMVPTWLPGSRRWWNHAATVAEGSSALLLARRRTARQGGLAAAATFCAVYVANVQAAVDGGYRGVPGWLGTRQAAVARLPLQVPLIWWALRVARDANGHD